MSFKALTCSFAHAWGDLRWGVPAIVQDVLFCRMLTTVHRVGIAVVLPSPCVAGPAFVEGGKPSEGGARCGLVRPAEAVDSECSSRVASVVSPSLASSRHGDVQTWRRVEG